MAGDSSPSDTVLKLICLLAEVVSSGAAISSAALEWRTIRRLWLEALAEGGLTEADAREIAAASRAAALEQFFANVPPKGSA